MIIIHESLIDCVFTIYMNDKKQVRENMSDIVVEFNYLRSNVHMITAMITACVFLERAEKDLKSRQRPWVAVYLQQKKSSEILWML